MNERAEHHKSHHNTESRVYQTLLDTEAFLMSKARRDPAEREIVAQIGRALIWLEGELWAEDEAWERPAPTDMETGA